MTQPSPEPFHFDPPEGSDPSETPDLLGRRTGLVAVLVTEQAHESGWAPRAAVALAEAALAAGNTVGLVDLALDEPRLQAAAGTEGAEGLSDIVLFGASVDRVSGWSSGGARIIGAGTPVDAEIEAQSPGSWVDAARLAEAEGCVLAYVRAGSAFEEPLATVAEDVIVLRHFGEMVTGWSGTPSLVLEPSPAPVEGALHDEQPAEGVIEVESPEELAVDQAAEVELAGDLTVAPVAAMPVSVVDDEVEIALDDGALDDSALDDSALTDSALTDGAWDDGAPDDGALAAAAEDHGSAPDATRSVDAAEGVGVGDAEEGSADEGLPGDVQPGEVEVSVDLDDVAGDSEGDAGSMFSPPPAPTSEPEGADSAAAEVAGLEVEPEWPDFEQPLVVHEPGEVDPLVAAGGSAPLGDATEPDALDDVLGEGAEVNIVSDDLGTGTPVAFDEEVTSEVLDGLVNPSMQSLSPAGGEGLAAAEHVSGLETPADWEGLPDADGLGVHDQPSEALDTAREGPTADEPAMAAPLELDAADHSVDASEDSLDLDDSTEPAPEAMRLEDPWGEPEHVAPAAEVQPPPETLEGFDEAFADQMSDPLPWETDAPAPTPAAAPEPDVPVANVTRTRTRTRTKGPRPFLLILILLLIATVAVLQWVGLLDVAGLGFLRDGGP